jgi:hypothetical protein
LLGFVFSGNSLDWVTDGTFDLPFSPNRLIGSSTNAALARVIGGWQIGWISTVQSGAPLTSNIANDPAELIGRVKSDPFKSSPDL